MDRKPNPMLEIVLACVLGAALAAGVLYGDRIGALLRSFGG